MDYQVSCGSVLGVQIIGKNSVCALFKDSCYVCYLEDKMLNFSQFLQLEKKHSVCASDFKVALEGEGVRDLRYSAYGIT